MVLKLMSPGPARHPHLLLPALHRVWRHPPPPPAVGVAVCPVRGRATFMQLSSCVFMCLPSQGCLYRIKCLGIGAHMAAQASERHLTQDVQAQETTEEPLHLGHKQPGQWDVFTYYHESTENSAQGRLGGLVGETSACGSGHDPRVLGSSSPLGSPQGAHFSLHLCLCLSLCVSHE